MGETDHPPCYCTCAYKEVDGIKVELDVYLPPEGTETNLSQAHLRPAIVYFHGGGLIVGEKDAWFPYWIYNRAMVAGYAFITANYRLLVPSSAHDIVADIKDLFIFIKNEINHVIRLNGRPEGVDSEKLIVAGNSAGGTCAYLAAINADPKPKAMLSVYGMGGELMTPHYLSLKEGPVYPNRERIEAKDYPEFVYPKCKELNPTSASTPTYHGDDYYIPGYPSNPRMLVMRIYLQAGDYLDYYTGQHSPSLSEGLRDHLTAKETVDWKPLIPPEHLCLFAQFNASKFPPSYLIHGTADTLVDFSESLTLYNLLVARGVPVVLKACEGMEHSFDYDDTAEDKWGSMFDEAFEFVSKYI
ncbi:hypothetical protein Clacol_007435 [Clathrus columnatus]|uniref:BD-FAE-like domain-containing protein n=1 Tax=Clathrus columnatus TaxID=1419009 RepID=A0AAV5AEX1_9AGAM|nr:hypothetical protein Clacol_007435 [Clathrus columnatus]